MGKRIPIDVAPRLEIEIESAPVALALGLEPAEFLELLDRRQISQLCERGTGPDEGLFRATFYLRGKRARVVVDRNGAPVGPVEH